MATIQQLAPQTGAVTTPAPFYAAAYPFVTVSADNLAGAETVTIYQEITPPGGITTYTPAVNGNWGVAVLTAALPSCDLPGGLVYAFTKTATAGLCGVYLTSGTGGTTSFVAGGLVLVSANNLSDVANAGASCVNLGLGSIATQAASAVAITGGTIDSTAIGGSTPAAVHATTLNTTGHVGIGVTAPTAVLHLKAGTATANTAPIKLTSGVNLTTPEDGALEYDGTDLWFTVGSARRTLAFGPVGANVSSATSITPTGKIFHVTGTTTVQTIVLPYTGFVGPLVIIPDGVFVTGLTGNIALASTTVVGKALSYYYDVGTSKWYPSY